MQLASFSVTNYRSITTAYKLPITQSTILIGPNNEGKSNILRALVTSLEVLRTLGGRKISGGRIRIYFPDHERTYNWFNDFPITLQDSDPDGESVFNIEFRLTQSEVEDFYSEVGSTLNGTLPIRLTLGKKEPGFKVIKRGPGAATLSGKAEEIADFVAKRININYIPAIRTSEAAEEIVNRMVERELSAIESNAEYQNALSAISKLQQPHLARISERLRETLKEFLPNVKQVKVSIPREAKFRALRRSCEIVVDDGSPTRLSRKGDGVQSLAALSLMRHASETGADDRELILAIEEPESHLHPNAIHQLKSVLTEIAGTHQVIMTTHCPLFVDRTAIRSNIIVNNKRAAPATSVVELRQILGVRASDNLQHAELILTVEGEEDRKALKALLIHSSPTLASAIAQGSLGIESLQGGSNLSYKLSQIREAFCAAHSLLDHDATGQRAFQRAEVEGLATMAEVTFTTCQGMQESEIEDLYDESLYANMIFTKYGVSLESPKFKGRGKWSDRMKETFKHQGKTWSDIIESRLKSDVADLVEARPGESLNEHRKGCITALIGALEKKLLTIKENKK